MRKLIIPLLLIALIVAAVIYAYPKYQLYKARTLDNLTIKEPKKTISLSTAIKFSDLGDTLFARDLIKDVEAFNLLVNYKKYIDIVLQPGAVTLLKKWDNNTLVNQLYLMRNQGVVKVTYNNVRNIEEIAEKVATQLSFSKEDLLLLLQDPETIEKYGFTENTYPTLFIPTTFEMYANATPQDFLDKVAAYYRTFWYKRGELVKLIGYEASEITILASIVYEEQKVKFDEQPKIAGLYINRLKNGWTLDADPTVKFAVGDHTLKRLLYKHLEVDSPYNTYKHKGLPPGPISIPEAQTIDAVLNYEQHDYFFMCAKPEYSGYHNFSKTIAQHNAYAKQYHNWLNKEGLH